MKLLDIPRESKIKVLVNGEDATLTFHHLDGMYSFCTVDGKEEDNVVNLSCGTPLKLISEGLYEIII